MTLVRTWIYAARPDTEVGGRHYRMDAEEIALDPGPGEVAVEARYWSVDPYMRIQQSALDTWEAPHPLGEVQGGAVVGRVVACGEGAGLAPGDWVETYMGWRTAGLRRAAECRRLDAAAVSPTTALHVLGMPGRTAYFGLFEAGRPKPSETLLVSGAAGAVGSIVGQLGKLAGLRVVGVVGSSQKAAWLTGELGFDATLNYRDHPTMEATLAGLNACCPDGVDVYFDNTGGHVTDAAIVAMNERARIIICGQISQYQGGLDQPNAGPRLLHHFLYKRASMQGILARDHAHRMDEMLERMTPWVRDGRIRYSETVLDGFERLPEALAALFSGANTGKMLVRAQAQGAASPR